MFENLSMVYLKDSPSQCYYLIFGKVLLKGRAIREREEEDIGENRIE